MEKIGTYLTQLAYYKDPDILQKLQEARDKVDSPYNTALKVLKGMADLFYKTPLASMIGVPGIVGKLYGPLTAGLDDAINMTSTREKINKFEENRKMFLKAEPKIRADYENAKKDLEEWKKMTYERYVAEQTKRMKGGAIPSSDLLHRMQKGTYRNDGPAETRVGDYQLIETTPTMNLYNSSNKYVVAIRGTTTSEADDIAADLLIPFDELKRAPRFKKDLETLKKWKAKYGPGEWYGVGHSLGGAILDEFLLMGLLDEGVSYNPAISYANTQKDIKNRRIYKSGDPLYNVMGRFTKSPEVRQSTEPYDGFINRKEHSIKQFEGGNMKKFHNQLKKAGLTHELYMKAVKKLAKESGYDPSKVEMSDDGVHKLVYHSPEGLKRFGRVGYGDYIIWSFKEAKGKVPEGYAAKKRNTFRKSHGKMSEIYNLGKYSENELAINLLW
jgi:hypothetical protein